jgi:hypothetical protein
MRWLLASLVLVLLVGCDQSPPPSLIAPASGPCAGIPVFPRDKPLVDVPLTTDPTLEGRFPARIDGLPVTDITSGRLVETLCLLGGEPSVNAVSSSVPAGLNLSDIRVASAQGSADGSGVTLTAFRLPGHPGTDLIPALSGIAGPFTGDDSSFSGGFSPATVGGKSVSTWANPASGAISYVYSVDDTLFLVSGVSPSQANKIFAALP